MGGATQVEKSERERETTYLKSILEALLKRLLRQIVLKDFYSKPHCWLACCCFSARKSKEIIRPPSCAFEVVHLLLLLAVGHFLAQLIFEQLLERGLEQCSSGKYVVNMYFDLLYVNHHK